MVIMQYLGQTLVELKSIDWDGKSRPMLVCNTEMEPVLRVVVGYIPGAMNPWVDSELKQWRYCAEIVNKSATAGTTINSWRCINDV